MINALTGEDLLPSSPIPTSANIVKVRKTETDYAIIHHDRRYRSEIWRDMDFQLL